MARKWWTLTLVCVAAFMLLLDLTIVSARSSSEAGVSGHGPQTLFEYLFI
jgi:hypothetical protein